MAFAQVVIPANTWIYVSGDLSTNDLNVQVSPGRPMLLLKANITPGVHYIIHDTSFKHYYVKASEVKVQALAVPVPVVPLPPVVTVTPPTAESCKVFSDAAYASGKTDGQAAGAAAGVTAEQARIKGVLGLK